LNDLQVSDIHKSYGETHALRGVSFSVSDGEIVAVLGPSGCGKSTLLSIIAGLEIADKGEIFWNGQSLENVPPHQRGFGLMFQDYALFPHMNVFDNIAFGLRMTGIPPSETQQRVLESLQLVGLPGYEARDVNTLSGGEQQRVALARSLAPQPQFLMLDEPLGSLDRTLREGLMLELRAILRKLHQTALYVTHDQEEAFSLADRVVVMNIGGVAQIGIPQTIYNQPASLFVARFLGLQNLFPGQIRRIDDQYVIETPLGRIPTSRHEEGKVTVLVRPEAVHLDDQGEIKQEGIVVERTFRGGTCRAVIGVGDVPLTLEFPSNTDLPTEGEQVQLSFNPLEAVQIFR
jgi:ABC-type Fe3+/spermidine/putrescine transport system ATPase subunit